MAAQVSLQTVDSLGAEVYVSFNVVLTGNYPAGGDPLNFSSGGTLPATQDAAYIGMVAAIEGSQLLQVDAWSQGGNLVNQYVVNKTSTNPATGAKLKISAASSFGTEFTAGAYSAALLADLITGFAIFTKLI